jgi:uncharacterized membrane protein YhaH (DUF805 family)
MDETAAVPPPATPTAGWYPDPQNSDQERWWTGHGWSEHVQTQAPVIPPPPYGSPPEGHSFPASSASPVATAYAPPIDPLSAPLYAASFGEAFARFWKKYATFSGRASRSEYWWVQLVFAVVYILTIILSAAAGNGSTNLGYVAVRALSLAWEVAILIPALALLVRRLHDGNHSGWYILLGLIPVVGGLTLLIWSVRDSDPHGQRFDRR